MGWWGPSGSPAGWRGKPLHHTLHGPDNGRPKGKYSNTAIISDSSSVRRDLPLHFYIERYTQSYVTEIEAFVDAVLHDKPLLATGYDGRMALVLGLAAKKSLAEHRPVHLSEIDCESN